MLRAVLMLIVAMGMAMSAPALAQEELRPGQYRWYDSADYVPAGMGSGVTIVVSIPQQLMFVYRDGGLIGVSTVSTGKTGKETPPGYFTILQKKPFHRSNLYSNAPMPWMQRLTWDGIALHAGHLPGYPASHGCIRLPAAFAKRLYALTELGAEVSVIDDYVDEPLQAPDSAGPPILYADTSQLGGEAFNMVTVGAAKADEAERRPASWVLGPAREIVQPIPGRGGTER